MSRFASLALAVILSTIALFFLNLLGVRARRIIVCLLCLMISVLCLAVYFSAASEGQGDSATGALALGMISGAGCLLILIAAVLDRWLGPNK